eukprot:CAMPEP_0181292106 /NCGR_PEP_ID=MMETSP1101-20121128/2328_1 /TAXON_ID=46948 /ORGANISM="Rhodomonas abbreviata, Strain Caron Lab Isolate" /LENGTH=565 /DNA_ID=CAMNT_0023396551 /DNA_START=135 /DNA_END=1832 /DNA_ORIENTATION=-
MATAVFGLDELYFGSVPIAVSKAPGKSTRYIHSQWKLSYSDEDLSKTVARTEKYIRPGDEDAPPFVIPGIPAREIVSTGDLQQVSEPSLLSTPLIKVPVGSPDALNVKGVASGVRSGLLKGPAGEWYRLKGCGNNDEGFIIRTTQAGTDTPAWRDIRGSAFKHTALRECFMAQETIDFLEAEGFPCCNAPYAFFEYGEPLDLLGPERPLACIVEVTRGDRRLGTHVLAGLQLLLPALVTAAELPAAAARKGSSTGWFPPARPRQSEEEGGGAVPTPDLMTDMMLAIEMGVEGHGLTWPDVPRDETTLAFLGACALPESAADALPKQWTAEGSEDMDPRWEALWSSAKAQYNSAAALAAGRGMSVLGYLYSRLGLDCGRILRRLHDKRVSWGTYQDDMCRRDFGEFHCNAHANNLVLLPPPSTGSAPQLELENRAATASAGALVGLLDLDMAFDEASFVDIWGSKGPMPRAEFDALLRKEHVNFLEVLAGGDASSGVPMVGQRTLSEMPREVVELQGALTDSLVLGYLRGYTGEARYPAVEVDEALHAGARAAMEMAVIVMADFIA